MRKQQQEMMYTQKLQLYSLKLSDIESRFICSACGKRGADVRSDWQRPMRMQDER
jgi:hypothetical protein